jgi:hypothetical protein
VTPGKPDTAGAAETMHREGAPQGAPEPRRSVQQDAPAPSVPAGDPEAPVGPVASVESESVAAPPGDASGAEAAGAAEDHERQLEHDLEELTAKAEKADEYLDLAKRTKADFENYRKRAAREAAVAQERGIARLAKELLPAVDNLDRALQAAQAAAQSESGADGAAGADNGTTATLVSGINSEDSCLPGPTITRPSA